MRITQRAPGLRHGTFRSVSQRRFLQNSPKAVKRIGCGGTAAAPNHIDNLTSTRRVCARSPNLSDPSRSKSVNFQPPAMNSNHQDQHWNMLSMKGLGGSNVAWLLWESSPGGLPTLHRTFLPFSTSSGRSFSGPCNQSVWCDGALSNPVLIFDQRFLFPFVYVGTLPSSVISPPRRE